MSSEYVECQICHFTFKLLGQHVRRAHDVDIYTYLEMFPGTESVAEITRLNLVPDQVTRQAISDKLFGRLRDEDQRVRIRASKTPEVVASMSKSLMGHEVSERTRRLISIGNTGHVASEETRQLLSRLIKGREVDEATRERIRRSSFAHWQDPVWVAWWLETVSSRGPNASELRLYDVLDEYFPNEWKFVGNGDVSIGGRLPDFININGKKVVIEMFGCYWHDPDLFPNRLTEEELIAHYKAYGFSCLVFWEDVVWGDEAQVVERVKTFLR